ncbi:MAG TPA: YCF48-related protein [Pyrinomonadaceae bacterium]|nr:YCF48-related protein [Pyrinomonadaceae bacterium]
MLERIITAVNRSRFLRFSLSLALMFSLGTAAVVPAETKAANHYVDGGNVFVDDSSSTQWSVVGPDGGDVRVVEIDPRDKDKIYITTMDGQIHVSNDAGKTWRMLARFDKPQLVLDQLSVDSRDSNIIYASGHRGNLPGGFFKTTDGGRTWKEVKDLRNQAIHAMTQSEFDPNVLLVGTKNGVFISRNSGDDWKRFESDSMPLDINSISIDPRNLSTIIAGTTHRPYKSTDSGKTWRLIKTGMIDDSDIFAITVNPTNRDHVIASACSGIYESFNNGENWSKFGGIPSTSRRTRAIVQHPTTPSTLFAGTTQGFWMSTNAGKTWIMTTQRNLEVNSIAVHPDEPRRVFLATNNHGVLVSRDGGRSFAPTNDNFTSRFTYTVTADLTEPNRLYATTKNTSTSGGFLFYSSDGGVNWAQARGLDINRVSAFTLLQDRKDPNRVYLGTSLGLFISLNRGVSWSPVTAPKPPVRRPAPARGRTPARAVKPAPAQQQQQLIPVLNEKIKVLVPTEDDRNGMLAATDFGIYRTYDLTKGWEKITFGEGIDHNVFAIATSPLVPGTIWAGTATSGVIVSRDEGETWSQTKAVPEKIPVSSIAIDPKQPNRIYVGTIHSLYVTHDGGRTWTRRGRGLPLGNYTSILIDPRNSDEVFVSSALETDGGVFYSKDAGANWKRIDSKDLKIPSRRIWTMVFDPVNADRIYAGTHSSGVYVIERNVTQSASSVGNGSITTNDK